MEEEKKTTFLRTWFKDFWGIFLNEIREILSDSGVILIYFVAGLAYPMLYSLVYANGIVNDTPMAVVDMNDSEASRDFIREVDATREVSVAYHCMNMEEAQRLMTERKAHGILYIPSDFSKNIVQFKTATVSLYCDMTSFLYYKNDLMGVNHVMIDKLGKIEVERYTKAGYYGKNADRLAHPIIVEDHSQLNTNSSYTIFLVSAIYFIIIQQLMFYGMSLLVGTQREENRSFASLPDQFEGHGVNRVVLGRGLAYLLVFMGIGLYIAFIVPSLFGIPIRGQFLNTLAALTFFVVDCIFFSMFWSSLITRRESVFVLFLFMSPICLFLAGSSWPTFAFPKFWKLFSYIFPSTFGCKAYINGTVAGGDISIIGGYLIRMTIQTIVYYFLACAMVHIENKIIRHKDELREIRDRLAAMHGIDIEKNVRIIAGEKGAEEYFKRTNKD